MTRTMKPLHHFQRVVKNAKTLRILSKTRFTSYFLSFFVEPNLHHRKKPEDDEQLTVHAATNAPLAEGEFSSLGLAASLSVHLTKMNIKTPTYIQRAAIPQMISSDSDAFIQAETGSGKTLAYLLPIVHRITASSEKMRRDSGCFAIILAPTRELGRQIHSVLQNVLAHHSMHWLVPILLLGGEKKKSEKARLRKGGNILVATPGRLADHLENTSALDVGHVRWVILDEGDRLMDLGFEETIQNILDLLKKKSRLTRSDFSLIPSRRITVLCSATLQGSVQRLGEMSLEEALFIKGDTRDSEKTEITAPAQLQQSFVVTPAKLRLVTLAAVLKRTFARKKEGLKVMVFFSCADSVDFHFNVFSREDQGSETICKASTLDSCIQLHKLHGSLQQRTRTSTLATFYSSDASVLFCTDVAARGLDLPNVDLVIQYDPPFSKEDYFHRIGRTARAGRDGRAIIFLLPGSEEKYTDIIGGHITRKDASDHLKVGFSPALAKTSLSTTSSSSLSSSKKRDDFLPMTNGESWENAATEYHLDIERWALSPTNLAMARRAFQSHIRAYATHVHAEREMFDIKALHLGHLAKAFGLRDKPGNIPCAWYTDGFRRSTKGEAENSN